jgi:hypothetical protein
MSWLRQSLGPSAQGRSSGAIPSEPATARASVAPSLESRVNWPRRVTFARPPRCPGSTLRGDGKRPQDRRVIGCRAMQPCDPETCDFVGYRNANRAPLFRERDPRPHPHGPGAYQKRARRRVGPRLAEDKALHGKYQKSTKQKAVRAEPRSARQRDIACVGERHRPVGSGSGARPSAARASLMVSIPFVA